MKRLIICSDGTWNRSGNTDGGQRVETNVEKMYQCICSYDNSNEQPIAQVKYYDRGISAGHSWKAWLPGGITGAGIDKNIKDIYTFLILNYQPGDEIYLFGFSRGAYTARSIGGLIRNCGILKPEYPELIDKAYELYRNREEYTAPGSKMMVGFRKQFAWEDVTPVKFIGVWDTVGSLGIPRPWYRKFNLKRYQFHDVTLSSSVENACQALAIDERRKSFIPALWKLSNTVKKNPNHQQRLEQRWFAGVHSNIGGGYADTGLSNLALKWLAAQAGKVGLCYDDKEYAQIKGNPWGELRNSYTPLYWFWLPVWRPITLHDDTCQTIDESVLHRFREMYQYRPGNLKKYINVDESDNPILKQITGNMGLK
jgi:uncharacterized protein (DUF2235 family)